MTWAVVVATLLGGAQVQADPDLGAYLIARQAEATNDFDVAARYFAQSLARDAANPRLMESAMYALVGKGDIAGAASMAQELVTQGAGGSIAHLMLMITAAQAGDWAGMITTLDQGRQVGPLVNGLARAWAHMGLGQMQEAMEAFDAVIASQGMAVYGVTHKAYALASVGDFEWADALLSASGMAYSRQSAIAHAQIVSQLGRNDTALMIIASIFGAQPEPVVAMLRDDLRAGEAVAYSAVRTPAQGIAELFHAVAGIVQDEAPAEFTLIYTRAANYLAPENTAALLFTARLLEEMEQYELASATYSGVMPSDPAFAAAELGRAEVLASAGRREAAVEVLEGLSRLYPDLPEVHATKGDTLRQSERYQEAERAYTQALALYDDANPAKWFVYYTRAITRHILDDWPQAEADFRAALALRPDQPQVLNYLGYSLVERGEKLQEALEMIQTAAAARPDNGAIVDSLGWVLFRLGDYEEAVVHLERAASLSPVDPVINDHLGDAFWAVGRRTEARFQWQRALSFDPEEKDAKRIRAKLDRGLDAVLAEEGADPIQVAGEEN